MPKPRVLFLYNGGTIGQISELRNSHSILVPPKDGKAFQSACKPILEKFEKRLDIDFELVTTKDSTNMTPLDWQKLVFRVAKAQDKEGYDGVAIVHGTDTMAYTATALALALHGATPDKSGLRIPVCLTGSQNTIYQEGGDGRFNLENLFRTLERAIDKRISDVLVNFWNRIHLGCRTVKVSEKDFDAILSPAHPDVGRIDAWGVHLNHHLTQKKENALERLELAPEFGRGVVSFELMPGLEPEVVRGFIASSGINAVILKSLGEGNVCTEGNFNLLPTITEATQKHKIPIFITTKFTGGNAMATHYEVGYEAIKAGGIPCFDHTDVAVDVKVRWLIGNKLCSTMEDYRRAMRTNYAGEMTPQRDN